jgi:hypothetical protein
MAIPGLKNIPSEYRDLYEHTYEILKRLRDRQAELTVLMQDEKDSVKRAKYSKERTNINRWLGDVTQSPETFTGIELSKYNNKQLGQRVHTVARSLMDRFNIDPRTASLGGSTQHHTNSIMQMQGAYENASIDTIFKVNQSLKEQDIYLGTNLEGRNFYDVDISTHPDFHKLTPEEKVDYSNTWAKINSMPTATPEERVARIVASSEITQNIAKRAAGSPLYLKRAKDIQTAAESVNPSIVQEFGKPFDPNIVGEAKLQRAGAYRKALITFFGGNGRFMITDDPKYAASTQKVITNSEEIQRFQNRLMSRKSLTGLAIAGVAAPAFLGTTASSVEAAERYKVAQQTKDFADETQATLAGVSLAGDVASYFPPAAPIGEAVSTTADVANIATDLYREDPERAKRFVREQITKVIPKPPVVQQIQQVQRAVQAVQRGGKLKFNAGKVQFTLPEFGLSELLGIN